MFMSTQLKSSLPWLIFFNKSSASSVRPPHSILPTYLVVFNNPTSPGGSFASELSAMPSPCYQTFQKEVNLLDSTVNSIFHAMASGSSCHIASPTMGAWRLPCHSCGLDCTLPTVEDSKAVSFKIDRILIPSLYSSQGLHPCQDVRHRAGILLCTWDSLSHNVCLMKRRGTGNSKWTNRSNSL